MTKICLAMGFAAVVLSGCSGGATNLSKSEDQSLRNNFSRSLTPEEVAQMGSGSKTGSAENAGKGATPPDKQRSQ